MCYMCLLETGSVSVTEGLRVVLRWKQKEATCPISLCLGSVSVRPSASARGFAIYFLGGDFQVTWVA